mmetsp:Transcript_1651/g.2997  ORF Transcript_1651/g.2997 Transcript_1651/m.2997 type:complete len:130 (-) Transcript_1651:84-473(-)|eukprot:CAMPEP_0118648960 /NCGR_PEP_ID=MMETSP0785-20121206/9448_1 /TAXON_ID=91992 /ORGANISM="Bolidomonas pacifica, Strain CCMP 1866" /LENGTH=129 /DNA_ID=CAMNT_0006541215 /DNA_START=32 /DNA_END=421 /DNA_ORIENTATION=-
MGKGSNVQKAQAARERNQKKMGKSAEERKEAAAKAAKDSQAFMCTVCRQTFMVNVKLSLLHSHALNKHPDKSPSTCFTALVGYDPNAPAAAAAAPATAVSKPKKKKAKEEDLSSLLDAGLNMGKKKGKK